MLNKLHKLLFGFDADVEFNSWSWTVWTETGITLSPEGDYLSITQGWLCFQRRFAY